MSTLVMALALEVGVTVIVVVVLAGLVGRQGLTALLAGG